MVVVGKELSETEACSFEFSFSSRSFSASGFMLREPSC